MFLGVYCAVTLVGEDFTAYDNSQFTLYSLRGRDFPTPIWRESGRFFPLALQEYNLVGRVSRSVAAYHAIPMFEMLALGSILLVLDQRLSFGARACLAAFAAVLPSVVLAFTALIYSECDVIFWLGLVALSVEFFVRTRSVWWALAAVLSAQIALYYKEPVFVFLLAFSATRILLRARGCSSLRETLQGTETRLDLAIAAVSLAFVTFYAIVIIPGSRMGYLVDTRISCLQAIRAYLRVDWLIWIFAAFTLVRLYRVSRGAAIPELLWDGLACGALTYFAAYLGMGMVSEYYLAPADLIAAFYLGRVVCLSWRDMRIRTRVATAALAIVVVIQSFDLSTLHLVERKFVVQRKALIANIILGLKTRDPGRVTRLYFPFTPLYGIAEFAAYLGYRGAAVERDGNSPSGGRRVELYSAKVRQTGRCVPIRDFLCHAGPTLDEDLVVVFPDDGFSPSESQLYQDLERKLLAHDPQPQAHAWFFRSLDFFWKYASLI
ncbi:MAG TPA: hypothetical protein VGL72_27665 [Bryobacteraceae bacterium]